MKKLLIIGGVGMFVYGIYYYFVKQADLLKQFTYKIIGLSLDNITTDNISGTITIRFTSISDLELTVSNLNITLFLNGTNVGTLQDVTSFLLPARGYNDIPIKFSINPQFVVTNFQDVFGFIFQNKDATLTLDGNATASSGFIKATLPIKFNCSLKNMDCVQFA